MFFVLVCSLRYKLKKLNPLFHIVDTRWSVLTYSAVLLAVLTFVCVLAGDRRCAGGARRATVVYVQPFHSLAFQLKP